MLTYLIKIKKKISLFIYLRQLKNYTKLNNLEFVPENILYYPSEKMENIFDCGCGKDAELAIALMNKYKSKVICVDPTKKHSIHLRELEKKHNNLKYLQYAIVAVSRTLLFHESINNESGSISNGHQNIKKDIIKSYKVEGLNLLSLINKANVSKVDYIKLDLEGAEYDLINSLKENDLAPFKQIYIEFHHFCIEEKSYKDTIECVNKIRDMGFKVYSLDFRNFLFVSGKLNHL